MDESPLLFHAYRNINFKICAYVPVTVFGFVVIFVVHAAVVGLDMVLCVLI